MGASFLVNKMNPKMMIVALLSILLQLYLAILGLGGFSAFFSHPPLVALVAATFVMTGISFFSSGNLSSGEKEDRGNRWVLLAFNVIAIFIAYLPALCDRKEFLVLDGDTVRWTGVALMTAGSILRLWPVFVLGKRFSGLVAIQPGHSLVTTGIYSTIRNPSYLGLLIATLGWVLAFRSLVGVALVALLVPPLVSRMHAEEKLLREHFGREYDDYCSRTARLIPGFY